VDPLALQAKMSFCHFINGAGPSAVVARAAAIRAKLTAASSANSGTEIILTVPAGVAFLIRNATVQGTSAWRFRRDRPDTATTLPFT
jgi:hypothetical protein